mgnify:FL=1
MSRRRVLATGATGATLGVAGLYGNLTSTVSAQSASALEKWAQEVPVPSVREPDGTRDGVDFYDVKLEEFEQQLHPDLPPTTVWGFDGSYPGPTFDVQAGEPIKVRYDNSRLPSDHLFGVDTSIGGTQSSDYDDYDGEVPEVRNAIHIHGANIRSMDDGQSTSWKSPDGVAGPGYVKNVQDVPNTQSRGTLLYHPHALGITRQNVYAGLAGVYLLRDEDEEALNLPEGEYEVPLLVQDREFNADGSLSYPSQWTSEFTGDTAVVNGAVWPYMEVEPRRYRFRVVNASNARAYDFSLRNDSADSATDVPAMYQIASGHEFLEDVVEIGPSGAMDSLWLTAFERGEIIVDFSEHAGETLTLTNDADDISEVVQFRVADTTVDDPTADPTTLDLPQPTSYDPDEARMTRSNTLGIDTSSDADPVPRHVLNGKGMLDDGVTGRPHLGTTEVWEFENNSGQTHPIHMHLVKFRVIGRGPDGTDDPDPNERGPKDIVRVEDGETVRVVTEFENYVGKYPWHCHMLEHEDHEMMRMFEVIRGEITAYANDDGIIARSGVDAAKTDWENGDLSREVLSDVIHRWRSGEPVEGGQ